MKYYIKQKAWSIKDRFTIYDGEQRTMYYCEGEVFSLAKKLHLYDPEGHEVAFIHQKVWSFKPKFYINIGGEDIAIVVREFTWFKPKYTVIGPEWSVEGNVSGHEYSLMNGDRVIAAITKQWFTWADTYEIDIEDGSDDIVALCVILVIDAIVAQAAAAAAST